MALSMHGGSSRSGYYDFICLIFGSRKDGVTNIKFGCTAKADNYDHVVEYSTAQLISYNLCAISV